MNKKDENIYVYLNAKARVLDSNFEYSGFYVVTPETDMDTLTVQVIADMNNCFSEVLEDSGYAINDATIVSMNEISKTLYDRLHQ
jgi:ABC-type long-subunit fatty acid transport system fused permease/ATPase subunit